MSAQAFSNVVRPARLVTPQMDPRASIAPVADYQGEQLQRLGGALTGLGQVASHVLSEQVKEANRVRVVQGQNAAMRAMHELTYGTGENGGARGYSLERGEAALAGEGGVDLATRYGQQLRERLDAIEQGLGNDVQRQAFSVWRGQFENDFLGRVQNHQAREFQSVQQSAYQGAVELGVQRAVESWQDAEKVREAIDGVAVPGSAERYSGVRQMALMAAKAKGLSSMQAQAFVRSTVSKAHAGVLEQAVANGASAWAQEYIDKNKGDILAPDLLRLQNQIRSDLEVRMADQAVHEVFSKQANAFAPTELDRLTAVVRQIESGGQGDWRKDGKPLTSSAGARYAMQVMPATAKNPGFGIRPAADDSPEEFNRVGTELLAALSQKYGGNVAMALAAYNGGAAHVDKAVQAARKEGRPQDWPQFLRNFKGEAAFRENYAYIQKGLALYNGRGAATQPPSLSALSQQALALLGPQPTHTLTQRTLQGVERQYGLLVKEQKQRQEQAYADAADALWQSGGDLSRVPPAVMERVPPEKRDDLMRMAKTFAGDTEPKTDYGLYYELVSKPEALAKANLSQFFDKLAPAERKELIRLQQSLRSGKSEQTLTQVQGVGSLVENMARQIRVDKNPEKMGLIYADVQKRVTQAEQLKGGKLTPQEMRATVAQSFQQVAVSGWLWDSKKPAFALTDKDELVIPRPARDDIKAALQRHGKPVTEENIQALWRRNQGL